MEFVLFLVDLGILFLKEFVLEDKQVVIIVMGELVVYVGKQDLNFVVINVDGNVVFGINNINVGLKIVYFMVDEDYF